MCGYPGEEFCDECFVRITEGDTDNNWPCPECRERLSHICPRCERHLDEALPEDEHGDLELCEFCKEELGGENAEPVGYGTQIQ